MYSNENAEIEEMESVEWDSSQVNDARMRKEAIRPRIDKFGSYP